MGVNIVQFNRNQSINKMLKHHYLGSWVTFYKECTEQEMFQITEEI